MLFSFPNSFALTTITVCACVWICVRIDHGHQCLHMQKQSNHNFELIDKASPEASTLSLSLSLRLPIKISPFYRVAFQVNANFITHPRM